MPRDELLARLKKLISEYMGVAEDKVAEATELEAGLGLDSLDRIELMMAAEDEFGLEVGDDEVKQLVTVKDTLDLIGAKLG